MKEYELLRAEMMDLFKAVTQYGTVLYSAVAAILAFALQRDEFYLCMVPYVAILPLFLLSESKNRGICKIAAYMYVFLEEDEFHWEHRHHELEIINSKKQRRGSVIPYYYLAITCSAAALFKVYANQDGWALKGIESLIVIVITVISIIVMKKNKVNFNETRKEFITQWEAIKQSEKKAKEEQRSS